MAYKDLGADGILVHMLLGKLKPGDIPADVRDRAIRRMVELYFEKNTVLISGYGFDMLYAGPREAVLHAIFRQNTGCTHLIVGRDHAGPGVCAVGAAGGCRDGAGAALGAVGADRP